MKKLFLLSFVLISALACAPEKSTNQDETTDAVSAIQTVGATEFNDLISSESAQLIDVRTPAEVAAGHIEGAINIDLQGADFRQKLSELDPTKPVLVYCSAGKRSQAAAEVLEELGFQKVYNLENGLTPWADAGYSLVQ